MKYLPLKIPALSLSIATSAQRYSLRRTPISSSQDGVTTVARGENLFGKAMVSRNASGSMEFGTPRTLWIGISFTG